jgi:hypothetical protein
MHEQGREHDDDASNSTGADMIRGLATDPGLDVHDPLVDAIKSDMEHDVHGDLA